MTDFPYVVVKIGATKPWIKKAQDEKSAMNLAFASSVEFWGCFSVVRVDGAEPREIACYFDGRKFKNYVLAQGGKPEHVDIRAAINASVMAQA